MNRQTIILATLLALAAATPAAALGCYNWTLTGATGVIGKLHGYTFTAECADSWKTGTKTGVGTSTTTNAGVSFKIKGYATWNRTSGIAQEQLDYSGDVTGERHAESTCTQDPFLKDSPGGAGTCTAVKVAVDHGSGELYKLLLEKRFWAGGRFALVEAQALSAENAAAKAAAASAAAKSTPDAGPAKQAPMLEAHAHDRAIARVGERVALQRAAAPLDIEAESLVKAKSYLLAGGAVHVQPMGGFGNGWSGGEQLFWTGGTVGAVLDLLIDVPQPGQYTIELHMTRAPDYAQLQIQVDGQSASQGFDGKAGGVFATGAIQIGTFALAAGQHKVSFMITGKHPTSTGFLAGIDKLRLSPVGALR